MIIDFEKEKTKLKNRIQKHSPISQKIKQTYHTDSENTDVMEQMLEYYKELTIKANHMYQDI